MSRAEPATIARRFAARNDTLLIYEQLLELFESRKISGYKKGGFAAALFVDTVRKLLAVAVLIALIEIEEVEQVA